MPDDAPLLALVVESPSALALMAPGGDAVVPRVRTLAVRCRDDSRMMLEHLVEQQAFLEHGRFCSVLDFPHGNQASLDELVNQQVLVRREMFGMPEYALKLKVLRLK